MMGDASSVIAARGANGLASVLLLWLLIGMLTQAKVPGRLFAVYVTLQAIGAFLLSTLYAAWVVLRFGASASYAVLAGLGSLMIGPAMLITPDYTPMVTAHDSRSPTLRGTIGLFAMTRYLAGAMAVWVFLLPLGLQLGLGANIVGLAISAAIDVQIIGGLAATDLAQRFDDVSTNVVSSLAASPHWRYCSSEATTSPFLLRWRSLPA